MVSKRRVVAGLVLAAVALGAVGAEWTFPGYETSHFRISSPLPAQFVRYIEANAEAYYDSITPKYVPKGFGTGRLTIYFLARQQDTRRLLASVGIGDVGYGQYLESVRMPSGTGPALFTHRTMDDGTLSLWGTLFHEITHHFIGLNYGDPPAWFNEGLACLLGERTRIVKGRANIGHANPWRERALRKLLEGGLEVDVARLVSLSERAFYAAPEGYHLARALFFWLHETGTLMRYLEIVKERGYALATLEEATGFDADTINRRLRRFIETRCYPAADLHAAEDATGASKEALLRHSLAIQPDFRPAQLALAEHWYYDLKDIPKTREALKPVLDDPQCIEHGKALWVMGDTFYSSGDYAGAKPYYEQALPYNEYNEWRHWLSYYLGVCAYMTGDRAQAKTWFAKFLEADWEPAEHPQWTAVAKQALAE